MKEKVMEVFDALGDTMRYLYERWQDEREYEDFSDYALPIKTKLDGMGLPMGRMTKRPFGFHTEIEGQKVYFFLKVTPTTLQMNARRVA